MGVSGDNGASSSLPSPTANNLMLLREKALKRKVWGR